MASIDVKKRHRQEGRHGRPSRTSWFGIEPNVPVMHQVVTAQLAARRAGSAKTLTRAEVRGGGAKPWRQKGTGRARQGSIRAPHWRGGGVAHGPKTRSYAQRTPKKMIRLALRSALSDRAAEGKVLVVDDWGFDAPSTKGAVVGPRRAGPRGQGPGRPRRRRRRRRPRASGTSPRSRPSSARELNAYDVLVNDWVVFTQATLPGGEAPAPEAKADAEPEAETTEEEG